MNDSASVAERLHDVRSVDPAPYMEQALDEITEAVFLTGQWPANVEGKPKPIPEISLTGFLADLPDGDLLLRDLFANGLGRDNELEAYQGVCDGIKGRFAAEYGDCPEVHELARWLAKEARDERGYRG